MTPVFAGPLVKPHWPASTGGPLADIRALQRREAIRPVVRDGQVAVRRDGVG